MARSEKQIVEILKKGRVPKPYWDLAPTLPERLRVVVSTGYEDGIFLYGEPIEYAARCTVMAVVLKGAVRQVGRPITLPCLWMTCENARQALIRRHHMPFGDGSSFEEWLYDTNYLVLTGLGDEDFTNEWKHALAALIARRTGEQLPTYIVSESCPKDAVRAKYGSSMAQALNDASTRYVEWPT